MSRAARHLRRAALALLAAALVLLLLEWTVGALDVFQVRRLAELRRYTVELCERDAERGILRHRPGARMSVRGEFELAFDEHGLRGSAAVAVPKPAGTVRVLGLGGSSVLGWGVEDAATFLRRFERSHAAAPAGQPGIEVLNGGHVAFEPTDAVACFEAWRALDPDLVLLLLDTGPAVLRARLADATRPRGLVARILPSVSDVIRAFGAGSRRLAEPTRADRSVLRALAAACDAARARLVVAELGRADGDALATACDAEGIRYIDLRFTEDERRLPLDADPARQPNALAHDLVGKKLLAAFATHPAWLGSR